MTDALKEYTNELINNLSETLKTPGAYLNKIALTAVVLFLSVMIYRVLIKQIKKKDTENVADLKIRVRSKKIIKNGMVALVAILVLSIWIQAINALILIALLFGAFVIVMLRGLFHNIIGYFVIKHWNYFENGSRVEVKDIIGDVIDLNFFSFKLLEVRNWLSSDTETGRVIEVPNSIIFEESVRKIGEENSYIWHEINYILSFDSDWQEAENIMTAVGTNYFERVLLPNMDPLSKYYLENEEKIQPVFSLNTDEKGIIVNLRYLVDYRNGTSTKTALQREILTRFDKNAHIKFGALDIRILSEQQTIEK